MPFTALHLHKNLLKGVKELGFVRPTPVQLEAIPPALEGRDVLACAMTGSGKTAAFILPILNRLIDKPRGTTRALVLTPTRELAVQIVEDLNDLAVHTPITAAAVIGGVGMGPQEHAFRTGMDVIVATPGRLLDHLRFPYAKLDKLEVLVLDEADRMLDMGFLPDIRRILRLVPAKRQTLFFSATMPVEIADLSSTILHNPATIYLDRTTGPAVGITQAVYPVPHGLKSTLLLSLLRRGDIREALVFTRTKHRADRLADFLLRNGVRAERIHGNRSQSQRTAALAGFKSGRFPVLVATDIAARGIDVEALGHVVNFDVPMTPDDYIHRVGRTGRAEAKGDAFTFVSPEELDELSAIEKALGRRLPMVTVPDFDYAAEPPALERRSRGARSGGRRGGGGGGSGAGGRRGRRGERRGGRSDRGARHEGSDARGRGSHEPRAHEQREAHREPREHRGDREQRADRKHRDSREPRAPRPPREHRESPSRSSHGGGDSSHANAPRHTPRPPRPPRPEATPPAERRYGRSARPAKPRRLR
jgi:ATP-dependent RNA helicase RhlE